MQYLDECSICGQKFEGNKFQKGVFRGKHIQLVHKSTYEQYIIDNFYNGVRPVCKCGCGKFPKFRRQFVKDSWFFTYVLGHAPSKPHTKEHGEKIAKSNKKTMLERYGVENPMHIQSFKENLFKTNLEKYGFKSPMKNEKVKAKGRKTMMKNHGVEYALQSNIIKEKFKQTSLERFGTEHHYASEIIKNKVRETNQEKYGVDYYMLTQEFKDKSLKTLNDVYSVNNIMDVPEYKHKADENAKKSRLLKYGVEYFLNLPNYKKIILL